MFFSKEKKEPLFNPLEAKVGSTMVIDTIDLRNEDLSVKEVSEYKREIEGKTFLFTDYKLDSDLKVRALPDFYMVLELYAEFEFTEEFLGVVEDACTSSFNLDDENAEFYRCGDLTTPYLAQVKSESTESKIKYWDFSRQANDEAGYEYTDFIIVEQNDETGWFQVWRGQEVLKANLKVV